MNRRGFLSLLAGAAAAAAVDPELIAWRPGARVISIPSIVARPPFLISPEMLTRETLLALEHNLAMLRFKQTAYLVAFSPELPVFIGDTLNVRKPRGFIATDVAWGRGRVG